MSVQAINRDYSLSGGYQDAVELDGERIVEADGREMVEA